MHYHSIKSVKPSLPVSFNISICLGRQTLQPFLFWQGDTAKIDDGQINVSENG
jgi:hypothetical protein